MLSVTRAFPSLLGVDQPDLMFSWSPTLELTPTVPLRHGHAIIIDMSYAVTFAWMRGYISEEERKEFHNLVYTVGLSLDHPQFDEQLLKVATAAILK